jgi:hypothetical protein
MKGLETEVVDDFDLLTNTNDILGGSSDYVY